MDKLKKIIFYDSKIKFYSEKYFNSKYLISNSTLNKNHFAGTNLLENFIIEKKIENLKSNYFLSSIKFYIKNFSYIFIFFILKLINVTLNKKKKFVKNKNQIILIDTFIKSKLNYVNVGKIIINDNYYENLYNYLNNENIKYNLFIKFNDLNSKPQKIISLLIAFKNHSNVFTIFDFINFKDFYNLLKFIIKYPFLVKGIKSESKSEYFDQLLKYDLSENLHKNTFHNYSYYIAGLNINKLIHHSRLNVISWFENLPCNLTFYKGLRHLKKNIIINGCNFNLKYNDCRWHFVEKELSKFDIHPDKILVTGKKYLKNDNKFITYLTGPAFRYKDVMPLTQINKKKSNLNILIALPYNINEWINIIDLINKSKFLEKYNLFIKTHPDFDENFVFYKNKINFKYSLYKNNNKYFSVMISNSSGLTMEKAVSGTSIIIFEKYSDILSCHPMPQEGKGEIWDIAKNHNDFKKIFYNLIKQRSDNLENIYKLSMLYFNEYFEEFDEKKIKKNLNINEN